MGVATTEEREDKSESRSVGAHTTVRHDDEDDETYTRKRHYKP